MNELDIVRWAAGINTEISEFGGINDNRILYLLGIDEEHVVDLLKQHRMAHRLLHRYQHERPGWFSRNLFENVLDLCAEAEVQTTSQIKEFNQISKICGSKDCPLIPVKGFSVYALTGNPLYIYYSGDIDIFSSDSIAILKSLNKLGYSSEISDQIVHEYAALHNEDVMIELHTHFPVFSYPKEMHEVDLRLSRNPLYWVQTIPDLNESKIEYGDILADSTVGTTPDTKQFTIPNVTMTVFLLCAHAFKHYLIYHPSSYDRPISLRLSELCTIKELSCFREFDKIRFQYLIDKFAGQESVTFVSSMLMRLFGCDTMNFANRKRAKNNNVKYPRQIRNWKCWVEYNDIEKLLLPRDPHPIITGLGNNKILASTKKLNYYSAFAEAEAIPLPRIIIHTVEGMMLPIQIAFMWGEAGLDMVLSINRPDAHFIYQIEIRGGRYIEHNRIIDIDFCYEVSLSGVYQIELDYCQNVLPASAECSAETYNIGINFPWTLLPKSVMATGELDLLILNPPPR